MTTYKKDSGAESIGGIAGLVRLGVFVFVFLFLGTLLNGWALYKLWGWFIAPVFGLPAISTAQSIGLAMVVSFLTYQYVDTQPKNESMSAKFASTIIVMVVRPLFVVLFGWIVQMFV